MKRYLCIYLPFWSAELTKKRLAREIGAKLPEFVLLVSKVKGQAVVKRFCQAAAQQGVKLDVPLALAKALLPRKRKVKTVLFDPNADFLALKRLAISALKYTPLVGVDSELHSHPIEAVSPFYTGLILDLSGTERLYKGLALQTLLQTIESRLKALNFSARLCVAPTIGAAWALSRCAETEIGDTKHPIVVSNGQEAKKLLQDLSPENLRIPSDLIIKLRELGLVRISQLLQIPRKKLASRFGVKLSERLDQAFGAIEEQVMPLHPPLNIAINEEFEISIEKTESLIEKLKHLFYKLFDKLDTFALKAGGFKITLYNDRQKVLIKELSLYSASKDISHLTGTIFPTFEKIQVEGGIDRINIIATSTEKNSFQQHNFLQDYTIEFDETKKGELLNSLIVRLGRENVAKVVRNNSHIPERAFSYQPIDQGAGNSKATTQRARDKAGTDNFNSDNAVYAQQNIPYPLNDRPSLFLEKPVEVQAIALLPDNPPISLFFHNKRHKIIGSISAESISEEWWHKKLGETDPSDRDYFKLQDQDGKWLWVFKERASHKWFVQGMFV